MKGPVHLTAAQKSRAAAKAVRMSMRAGEIADAYYIVNSLQSSMHPNTKPINQIPIIRSLPHRPFIPLDFGGSTSPRLASHILLHSLIRVGLVTKAYRLAQGMMADGIRVRTRSLDAVTYALLAQGENPPGIFDIRRIDRVNKVLTSDKITTLQPRFIADPSVRYAIRLIQRARHHRQRCSTEAMHSIVRYCLSRGKIIIASLLICDLVKEYQLRQTAAARLKSDIHSIELGLADDCSNNQKSILQSRLKNVLWEKGELDKNVILSLAKSVENTVFRDPQNASDETALGVSLQALANIAMLLDERRLPFPEVAPILRALYSCPKTDRMVWIIRDGSPRRVEAYSYFHDVLVRLALDPPRHKPSRKLRKSEPDPTSITPPLDLDSYNSLIHYALRHRFDEKLANNLLQNMGKHRKPLKPDVVTHNILIRAGTLLRKTPITDAALVSLRQHSENSHHGIMVMPQPKEMSNDGQRVDSLPTDSIATRDLVVPNEIELPSAEDYNTKNEVVRPHIKLNADAFTLTSYILHLTSTGRPHVVADILFQVLPELSIVDHPSWGTTDPQEASQLRRALRTNRRAQLHRAILLGPRFFVAVLNALCKAGKTGLTERVWILAKQAERASWISGIYPDISPWFLPVHAYTIMLQCYGAEARKGLLIRRRGRPFQGEERGTGQHDWVPRVNRYVRGWARFVLSEQKHVRSLSRASTARGIGQRLYLSMKDGGRGIFKDLMRLKVHEETSGIPPPRPDARFFNAAIELFARDPSKHSRSTRVSPARWRKRLSAAHMRYVKTGTRSAHWNPTIDAIVKEMAECGYSVPLGLRPLFIGRWFPDTSSQGKHSDLDHRPFAFPRMPSALRIHSLPTVKTRGLPTRRNKYRAKTSC